MELIPITMTLELDNGSGVSSGEIIDVSRGEQARQIIVSLYRGGQPYNLSAYTYAFLSCPRKPGKDIFERCTTEAGSNTVTYTFSEQTASAVGAWPCQLFLFSGDSDPLISPMFTLRVSPSFLRDERLRVSSSYSGLSSLISDFEEQRGELSAAIANALSAENVFTALTGLPAPSGLTLTQALEPLVTEAELKGAVERTLTDGEVYEAISQLVLNTVMEQNLAAVRQEMEQFQTRLDADMICSLIAGGRNSMSFSKHSKLLSLSLAGVMLSATLTGCLSEEGKRNLADIISHVAFVATEEEAETYGEAVAALVEELTGEVPKSMFTVTHDLPSTIVAAYDPPTGGSYEEGSTATLILVPASGFRVKLSSVSVAMDGYDGNEPYTVTQVGDEVHVRIQVLGNTVVTAEAEAYASYAITVAPATGLTWRASNPVGVGEDVGEAVLVADVGVGYGVSWVMIASAFTGMNVQLDSEDNGSSYYQYSNGILTVYLKGINQSIGVEVAVERLSGELVATGSHDFHVPMGVTADFLKAYVLTPEVLGLKVRYADGRMSDASTAYVLSINGNAVQEGTGTVAVYIPVGQGEGSGCDGSVVVFGERSICQVGQMTDGAFVQAPAFGYILYKATEAIGGSLPDQTLSNLGLCLCVTYPEFDRVFLPNEVTYTNVLHETVDGTYIPLSAYEAISVTVGGIGSQVTVTLQERMTYTVSYADSMEVTLDGEAYTMPAGTVWPGAVTVFEGDTFTGSLSGLIDATAVKVVGVKYIVGYPTGWISNHSAVVNADGVSFEIPDGTEGVTADVVIDSVELARVSVTVTYNMQGHGTQIASQTVAHGGMATQPTAPTAEGYTFGGWYTDAACTMAYVFSSAVSGDLTLWAKWTEEVEDGVDYVYGYLYSTDHTGEKQNPYRVMDRTISMNISCIGTETYFAGGTHSSITNCFAVMNDKLKGKPKYIKFRYNYTNAEIGNLRVPSGGQGIANPEYEIEWSGDTCTGAVLRKYDSIRKSTNVETTDTDLHIDSTDVKFTIDGDTGNTTVEKFCFYGTGDLATYLPFYKHDGIKVELYNYVPQ